MYNQSDKQIKSILDVWRAIEHLTPFKNENLQQYFEAVEEYKEKKLLDEKFSHKLKDEEALFLLKDKPFEAFDKKDLDINLDENDVAVYWNIYLGYLKWSEAEIDILKKISNLTQINTEILQDHVNQDTATITPIAALTINENMVYEKDSMVISTAAYALGEVTKDDFCEDDLTKLINFDDIDNSLIRDSLNYGKVINEGQIQLDLEIINRIIDFLVASLKIKSKYLIDRSEICVRRVIVSKKKKPEENKARESEENDKETKADEANNVETNSSSLSAPSLRNV